MNVSEFERNKPVKTLKRIKELEKLIKEEQLKTENLYANLLLLQPADAFLSGDYCCSHDFWLY